MTKVSSSEVGVVIPVYNRRRTVIDTLVSVVEQTLPCERLIVIDDGSTDGSADHVESWLREHAGSIAWQVVRAPHRNASVARQIGFELVAELPWVAFLDSDDRWPADFLERSVRGLCLCPDAVAITADRRFHGDPWVEHSCSSGLADSALCWLFENDAGIASATVFRADAIEHAGGWPAALECAEDFWLFSEIASGSGPWLHAPGAPVHFSRATESQYGEEMNLSRRDPGLFARWAEEAERFYRQGRPRSPAVRSRLRQAIGRKWADAGQNLYWSGSYRPAAMSFARAMYWHPGLIRSAASRLGRKLTGRVSRMVEG